MQKQRVLHTHVYKTREKSALYSANLATPTPGAVRKFIYSIGVRTTHLIEHSRWNIAQLAYFGLRIYETGETKVTIAIFCCRSTKTGFLRARGRKYSSATGKKNRLLWEWNGFEDVLLFQLIAFCFSENSHAQHRTWKVLFIITWILELTRSVCDMSREVYKMRYMAAFLCEFVRHEPTLFSWMIIGAQTIKGIDKKKLMLNFLSWNNWSQNLISQKQEANSFHPNVSNCILVPSSTI